MSKAKAWVESRKKELIFLVIIFMVATTSFALGYLFAERNNRAPIIIEQSSRKTSL